MDTYMHLLCIQRRVCARARVCVCVRARARTHAYVLTHTHVHTVLVRTDRCLCRATRLLRTGGGLRGRGRGYTRMDKRGRAFGVGDGG